MKVIKRDGRAVDFDREKIRVAISKANNEVKQKERATRDDIKQIIAYIEEKKKKRILVEDIQDIIEQKLMKKFPKESLARLHHQLVLFGRYYCTARNPKCENCKLRDICKFHS